MCSGPNTHAHCQIEAASDIDAQQSIATDGSPIDTAQHSILPNDADVMVQTGMMLQSTNLIGYTGVHSEGNMNESGLGGNESSDRVYAEIGPVYATLETEDDREERYRKAVKLGTKRKYESVDGMFKYEFVDSSQKTSDC